MKPLSGIWYELKPTGRSRKKRAKPGEWVFASYIETPTDRGDGQWYSALLFRNADRTVFGIKEWLGVTLPNRHFGDLAAKIVRDSVFRKSLISVDPDLPEMWTRH